MYIYFFFFFNQRWSLLYSECPFQRKGKNSVLLFRHEHTAKKCIAENRSLASHSIEMTSTTESGVLKGLRQFSLAALSEGNASFASFWQRVRTAVWGMLPWALSQVILWHHFNAKHVKVLTWIREYQYSSYFKCHVLDLQLFKLTGRVACGSFLNKAFLSSQVCWTVIFVFKSEL